MSELRPGTLSSAANTQYTPIFIVGVGGTGSRLAEALVRIGFGTHKNPLVLIDGDTFEKHNVSNQLVDSDDVGNYKVSVVANHLRFIRPTVQIIECPWFIRAGVPESVPLFGGIVILALDNMETRALLVEHYLENNSTVECVIDPRLDSGVGVSYCFDPNNKQHQECWWTYWHPDSEAENIAGCGGTRPVVGSIFGTAALALKQLEHYFTYSTAHQIPNRVYCDFDRFTMSQEVWPT